MLLMSDLFTEESLAIFDGTCWRCKWKSFPSLYEFKLLDKLVQCFNKFVVQDEARFSCEAQVVETK